MRNTLVSLLVVTGALVCTVWPTLRALAVDLPPGDEVLDAAWQSSQQMVLLVEADNGFALHRLDLNSGEISVIPAPRSFTMTKAAPDSEGLVQVVLAPSGTAVAVLDKADSPLAPPELTVYAIDADGLERVDTKSVPADFWPDQLAFSTDGSRLYLSAKPYLFPDQAYSIGSLEIPSGQFGTVALKANVDLITSLAYVPQRGALIANCRGFKGEYPDQPMIALVLTNGSARLLHSLAEAHWVNVLADGSVLVGADASEGDQELWLLRPGVEQLVPAQCAFAGAADGLRTNRNGSWMGFVITADKLEPPGDPADSYLVLQRTNDGKTMVTADTCADFAFSPDGLVVACVAADRTAVQFYNLPE